MYITYIKVNDGGKSDTTHFHYSNGHAIWHNFPNITHIKGNNGLELAISNSIDLTFPMVYPSLKLQFV